jgi:hypothetical protein
MTIRMHVYEETRLWCRVARSKQMVSMWLLGNPHKSLEWPDASGDKGRYCKYHRWVEHCRPTVSIRKSIAYGPLEAIGYSPKSCCSTILGLRVRVLADKVRVRTLACTQDRLPTRRNDAVR